jgi:hypothetical protein
MGNPPVGGSDICFLACIHDLQMKSTSEKYICICSDSQAALKTLGAAKTTSPFVCQRQTALNDTSTHYSVGLIWVPAHAHEYVEIKLSMNSQGRAESAHQFIGSEAALGISWQDITEKFGAGSVTSTQYCGKVLSAQTGRPKNKFRPLTCDQN